MTVGLDTLKDFGLIAAFIATCSVALWRLGAMEKMQADHEARIRWLERHVPDDDAED